MNDTLKVRLAGLNVDRDGLDEIKNLLQKQDLSKVDVAVAREILDEARGNALMIVNNLTPETIAASYARISRDGRPIEALRADSRNDVESARKSYRIINFTMGHKSIAEHATFNFDIMGLSRRSVEDVELHGKVPALHHARR
jgi:hypothetical protein